MSKKNHNRCRANNNMKRKMTRRKMSHFASQLICISERARRAELRRTPHSGKLIKSLLTANGSAALKRFLWIWCSRILLWLKGAKCSSVKTGLLLFPKKERFPQHRLLLLCGLVLYQIPWEELWAHSEQHFLARTHTNMVVWLQQGNYSVADFHQNAPISLQRCSSVSSKLFRHLEVIGYY